MCGFNLVHYMDEDEKILRERHKQQARELREFQQQLRKQKCFSEMDLTGKPKVKKVL